jgi:hypothetical protein
MSLLTLLAAGGKALLAAAGDLDGEFEDVVGSVGAGSVLADWAALGDLLIRFFLCLAVVFVIVRFFYYPKSRRRDYFFTFMLVSISVFMLIFFLGGTKLKTGVALGLFAIFSIIRYRTESVPIREMNYLFVLIAISVINGVGPSFSFVELLAADLLLIIVISICESTIFVKKEASKLIKYDNVKLVTPDKNEELLEDLKKRTGLEVFRVEVGAIDFLKDSAILRIYYKPLSGIDNSVDSVGRMPRG